MIENSKVIFLVYSISYLPKL